VKLTPQEQIRLANPHPVNPEAQEAYFRGVYWVQKGQIGYSRGFDYFQQAVTKDPNYAAAYAALSSVYDPLIGTGVLPAKEAHPKWRAAVTKALELDPMLADAYVSRGLLLQDLDWNWQDAERDFQRALQLSPNLALAHMAYAYYLMPVGQLDEAVTEASRAVQLNPFSNDANFALGAALVFAGRQDEALEQGRRMIEVNARAAHRIMGLAYEQKGNLDLAIGLFQGRLKDVDQDYPLFPDCIAELAHAYAAAGMRPEALRLLSELQGTSKRRFVPSWTFALIYAALGDKDQAFRWLDKGFDERPSDMEYLKVNPGWAPLRSDPRYQDLLRRMGLPP
jgi:tetratricopeptide (TPR) repeat protein